MGAEAEAELDIHTYFLPVFSYADARTQHREICAAGVRANNNSRVEEPIGHEAFAGS